MDFFIELAFQNYLIAKTIFLFIFIIVVPFVYNDEDYYPWHIFILTTILAVLIGFPILNILFSFVIWAYETVALISNWFFETVALISNWFFENIGLIGEGYWLLYTHDWSIYLLTILLVIRLLFNEELKFIKLWHIILAMIVAPIVISIVVVLALVALVGVLLYYGFFLIIIFGVLGGFKFFISQI
jgi:hypothetical protein